MEIPFGLHLKINFETIHDFQANINLLEKKVQKVIWLTGEESKLHQHINEINSLIDKQKLLVICQTIFVELGLKACAIICEDFNDIISIKKKFPDLKIGGIGKDIAECKNIEHFNGDFVYFGPFEEAGFSQYLTLSPKDPDYEWRFIDITIPVIGFGKIKNNELEKLTNHTNLFGFVATEFNFEKLNGKEKAYRFTTE